MQDRRKLKRRYLMFYSRVFDRKTGKLLGYLSDITEEGAMLIGEEPIDTETLYRLCMDLPGDVFGKEHLNFDAICRWCKRDVNPDFYIAGFYLKKIEPEDIEIIRHIIEDYGFRD